MQIDLQQKFYGNTLQQYLIVLASLVLLWLVLQIIKRWLLVYLKRITQKSETTFDDAIVSGLEKFLVPFLYLFINIHILRQLIIPDRFNHILSVTLTLITVYYVVRIINHSVHLSLHIYMRRKEEGPTRIKQLTGILVVLKAIIWILGFLFFLNNIGYNVTTIIAGLGVGGIAIALAAQNILGDLFSYFVIFFDKPFEIGDFIVVGQQKGTVERIGIKTSHVRSLAGEQLVIPNAELVKSTIHNFKRLERRRAELKVGVVYATTLEQLQEIPEILKSAVAAQQLAEFDRAHLQSLGDHSIIFEMIYFINSSEYLDFMNTQQGILIHVLGAFEKRGIEIAYPTQKVVLQQLQPSVEASPKQ